MSERADEQAELGRKTEGPEICPGPQKYGSLWLRVKPAVRELAVSSGKPLPRDSAPNRSLLGKTAGAHTHLPVAGNGRGLRYHVTTGAGFCFLGAPGGCDCEGAGERGAAPAGDGTSTRLALNPAHARGRGHE